MSGPKSGGAIETNSHRLLVVAGACLLVIGGVFLPTALATPPALYTYSAEQIDEDGGLSPSTLNTAADRKSTVVSFDNTSESEREALRNAFSNGGNWTQVEGTASDVFDYSYVVHEDELYGVERSDEPPAIRAVDLQRKEKLDVVSIDLSELPSRDHFGVRQTDTHREVVRHTIDSKRYSSFTRASVDNTMIDDEGDFYRITYEPVQNSTEFILWSFSVVFLSLAPFLGAICIVYVLASKADG